MRLSRKALLSFDRSILLAGCFAEEAGKCRFTGIAIESVGSLPKLDSVEQPLDVARDSIGSHDEGGIQCVDILARDRSLRVTDKCRDRDLSESKVVRDACKAVAQHMRGDVGERRIVENLFPIVGKAAECIIVALTGEDVGTDASSLPAFQILDDG